MKAAPFFPEARQKLRRAETHIRTLEAKIERFKASDAIKTEYVEKPSGDVELRVSVRGDPEEFRAVVGDAIHNLRAALDFVAVEIVATAGGNAKSAYFPFADSAENLESMIERRGFSNASAGDKAILRSLRPYKGGNESLRALHDLDIQDKHRGMIEHGVFIITPAVRVKTDSAGNPVIVNEKAMLELDPTSKAKASFVFPEGSTFGGENVTAVLWRLHNLTSTVVDQFAEGREAATGS
jgi:hypothetical protein